ncbi:tetratricopeptide repeat protein [Pseudoxanthomonas taiwanensis]|uniref:Adenylate cyclase n=1 Tax=Pseudoxanthomonas taiwanensis TaxID=176598 RepID=A0A921NTY4_9GAMM|nr:tetratricopeptide repeat protein [Pseudoxanthomonas taiwanensis]KAF1689771.1 adenylate cyclase [Pseudoxanthomonas taiwanensis]
MQEAIQQALQGGDLDKALALAREWAEASPDDAAARHALAVALAQSGDPDAALAALDEALRLAPENAWLHMDRAVLLVQGGRLEAAREALDQSLGLDPNLVPAYLAQARLALLRGDLDAAGQALRTAARIAPEGDPHLATVQAMLALRRGDAEQALRHASAAAERLPDDPQLLSVLALAYLARGHLAFAEQALRRVMELAPPAAAKLRPLLAQLVDAQRRPGEAVDVLAPLLEGEAAPALYRAAGLYALRAGRAGEALAHLRRALDGLPDDLAVLDGLMRLWQARGEREQARATLESVLAAHPDAGAAWSARLVLETPGTAEGAQVLERWLAAMPEHVPALHAALFDRERAGDPAGVEAFARRVLALRPEDFVAGRMLAETLLERDAEAALAQARALLAAQTEEAARAGVRSWLGQLLDRAGRPDQALAEWLALHAEHGGRLPPPPPPAEVAGPWPDAAAPAPETQVLLVWGAPGSGVERVVDTLVAGGGPVLRDRFGPRPPDDPLQPRHRRGAGRGPAAAGRAGGALAPCPAGARHRQRRCGGLAAVVGQRTAAGAAPAPAGGPPAAGPARPARHAAGLDRRRRAVRAGGARGGRRVAGGAAGAGGAAARAGPVPARAAAPGRGAGRSAAAGRPPRPGARLPAAAGPARSARAARRALARLHRAAGRRVRAPAAGGRAPGLP